MWNRACINNRLGRSFGRILKARGEGKVSPALKTRFYTRGDQGKEYDPKAGQRGKDVQWVPASPVVVGRMLDLAKVTAEDYVIDLGSGDGRIVISAAKLGAQALGIEFNPFLVELSRKNAGKERVTDKATFIQRDLFKTDFSRATVLPLFLRRDINIRLRSKILDMKPGTRIISNIFDMGEWKADEVVKIEDEDYYFKNHTVYFWVVPAKVGGIWKLSPGDLILEQNFQIIKGSLKSGGVNLPVIGKMIGDRISFTADGREYRGRVTGRRMDLETEDGSDTGWR